MNAKTIRCENDLTLFGKLLQHPDVVRTNEHLEKLADEGSTGLRRRLLATSVRLDPSMAKTVHAAADVCIEKLDLEIPVELYVFPSPQFNAACFKPEAGRLFVMFSSSLLEGFDDRELRFVMGHELGHHVYRHHDIPIGYILQGGTRPDFSLALELFAWSRYAEISADRAGAHCANDLNAVARALFKLASGLSGVTIEFNLEAFLAQVDDMQVVDAEPGQGAPKEDWFSTHPFSPLRVKALQLFHQSILAKTSGMSKEDLEVAVQRLMSLMEPSYLEGHTRSAEAMRRALFAGALAVASANDDISDAEIEIFETFFGKGSYTERLNIDKLEEELPARLDQVRESTSVPQRMQLLHDLCIIARAEGRVSEVERAVLDKIAGGLEVPNRFICQTLDTDLELD
ncbi:MAG: M48 family metallopeptidase [Gammaproteobacteria bacterium]|nr:M48 family metallopeptidase [Gammaproteobacteria bacterium]MDH3768310.1 M48 family metallopeptidase [Gammaproteobacteria bacterium]